MMSLWSLLNPPPRLRHFALLDAADICRALRESTTAPAEPGWVEVHELRSQWLGQPLPPQARLVVELRQPLAA